MLKLYTCILCPNGCEIRAEVGEDGQPAAIAGHRCPRGEAYVRQEICAPLRNIASSVLVEGGELPLCSVRLTSPIPKARIFDMMRLIHAARVPAPVELGQVLIPNALGLGCDVIATRNVGEG
ncbi:MAG: DUF1667 domain-containing protein [Christensenellaceae bacterium]|jgi:CxxC motif-containing protein|nr:DUF1667 domain-containing protein [Christensenellaceae bacterium]